MSIVTVNVQEPFIVIRFRLSELIADKAFNERRSVSMTEVAEGSGVHRATLSKMVNEAGSNIGSDVIGRLCRYFQCQPGDLMVYVGDTVRSMKE